MIIIEFDNATPLISVKYNKFDLFEQSFKQHVHEGSTCKNSSLSHP